MRYELFLAKRYALTKRSQSFITIISILSAVGIMVGVAALIIVLSVFNGFSAVVTNILVNFDPHIRITALADSAQQEEGLKGVISSTDALVAKIKTFPDVRSVAQVSREKAVLVHYTLPRVAVVTGIDERDADAVSGLGNSITAGKLQLDANGIILGQLLADNMAIIPGDTIDVYSPAGMQRILTDPVEPKHKLLVVRGIFGVNNRDYDAKNAYINLESSRDLFDIPIGSASSIELRLIDIRNSPDVKKQLEAFLPSDKYRIETWYDLHTELYSVMEMERWIAFAILIIIVAVASFSIFSALTLTVYEKKRDIGLLLALGAEQENIRRIYLYQGLLTGILGVLIGCVLGFMVVWAQQEFGFFKLDATVYIIPAMPVKIVWSDFAVVGIGAMLLVVLAAYFPSRKAAKVSPADALRWE